MKVIVDLHSFISDVREDMGERGDSQIGVQERTGAGGKGCLEEAAFISRVGPSSVNAEGGGGGAGRWARKGREEGCGLGAHVSGTRGGHLGREPGEGAMMPGRCKPGGRSLART